MPKKIGELSDAELADEIGKADGKKGAAEEVYADLKAEFDRRGLTFVEGTKFSVFKNVQEISRFDASAARRDLGAEGEKKYLRDGMRTTYIVKPLKKTAAR